MALKNVILPLFPDPFYSYSISLEGNSYSLEFQYNERAQLYYFSLYDADNNPIFLSHGLVPSYPISLDYAIDQLSGFFWMERKSSLLDEPYKQYPDKIDEYYNFFYSYMED